MNLSTLRLEKVKIKSKNLIIILFHYNPRIFLHNFTTSLAVFVKLLSSLANNFSDILRIFLVFSWFGFNPSN